MKKWYLVTCTVRIPLASGNTGQTKAKRLSQGASGYVIIIGLSASTLADAVERSQKLALEAFESKANDHELEEMQIKLSDESAVRRHLQNQGQPTRTDARYYRSGIVFYQ